MTTGSYFINFIAIGLAITLLMILTLVFKRGVVDVTEPRRPVLVLELLLMIGIIGLALYNLASFLFAW